MNYLIGYLFFDRINIQAANAISSPLTYGFPAITGFLGAIHALNRKLSNDKPLSFDGVLDGVLIACHDYQLKSFRAHPYADYTFNQTRNPLKKRNSVYQSPPIIEEGKIDLTVSLLIEIKGNSDTYDWLEKEENQLAFQKEMKKQLMQQRIAGGSVSPPRLPQHKHVNYFDRDVSDNELKSKLLPAFVLMHAKQELIQLTDELQQSNPEKTGMDALIETAMLHHCPKENEHGQITWHSENIKSGHGWLVPIPIGFQAIAAPFDPGILTSCRNPEYRSQYVESVYSLGKWVFPHSLGDTLENCFWRYSHPEPPFYLVTQSSQ